MLAERRRVGQCLAMIAGSRIPSMESRMKPIFVINQAENPLVVLRILSEFSFVLKEKRWGRDVVREMNVLLKLMSSRCQLTSPYRTGKISIQPCLE